MLSAGFHVPKAQWTALSGPALETAPSSATQRIRQANFSAILPALGPLGMGTIQGAGPPGSPAPWGVCANHQNRELFFRRAGTVDYRPALLARFPNVLANGSWEWAEVAAPCSAANITANLSSARLQRWSDEQEAWRGSGGLWMQSYFEWDWANALVHVEKVLPSSRQLVIDPNTSAAHTPAPGNRWLAVNALSELDDGAGTQTPT